MIGSRDSRNPIREIGCCGAYCRTCRAFTEGHCRGCKLGYDDGMRDIRKSRCRIKVCCFVEKELETCADCPIFAQCETIQGFYRKEAYKYKKYKQAAEFIINNGYTRLLTTAQNWKGAYGKID